MTRWWHGLVIAAMTACSLDAQPVSAFDEVGRFYVQNFGPEDYDAHAQNWTVVQNLDGLLYIGNNDGVLEYDGVSWRLIPVPNQSVIRSLATDTEGRVFVGAMEELGYLAPDSLGRMRYVSLVDHVPAGERDFGNVWRIEKTSDGLYFQTFSRLFRWDGRRIEVWRSETRFTWIFALRDSLYVQQAGIGLMRMVDDSLTMEPGGAFFKDRRIQGLVPQDEAEYLVLTRGDGLFRCATPRRSESACAPFGLDLTGMFAYRAAGLPESMLAIGTRKGGTVLLDQAGRLLRVLNEASGLRNEEVNAVFPDRQDGLWLGLNDGLARVEINVPVSHFDKADGLLGAVYGVARHQGRLYVTTSRGAFVLEPGTQGTTPRFLPVPGIATGCWPLLSTSQGLLAGCTNGVYNLEDGERLTKGDICFAMHRSRRDETLIFTGHRDGLARLRLRDERWIDDGRIQGVRESMRSIAEDAEGRIWLGLKYDGVLRFDPVRAPHDPAAIKRFGTEQGLPAGLINVESIAGRVIFVHRTGVFRLAGPGAGTARFIPDSTFGASLASQQKRLFKVVEDDQGRVWLAAGEASAVALPQPDGSYMWQPTALRRVPTRDVSTAYVEAEGTLWVGGAHGLIRLDTERSFDSSTSFPARIRRITSAAGSLLFDGKHTRRGTAPTWSYENNALRFTFAAPRHDAPERTRYRTRLDGFDRFPTGRAGDDWSSWTTESQRDFTNLWEGHYTFRVQARDVYGLLSQEDAFAFRILPPWYRTWWAYAFYGLSLATVVLAFVRAHHRKLRRERKVSARLREVDRLKDDFLATTSHELRTPLYGITGLAESLIDGATGELPEETKAHLAMIAGSGHRLGRLVNDILDYSKVTHKSLELRRRPVDLRPLVEVVLTLQGTLVGSKDLELINAVPADLPAADADEARLEQILHNLVGNAVKFTEAGKVEVSVAIEEDQRLTSGEPTRHLVVTVTDSGIGIAEDKREQIFEAFEQADAGVQRAFGGTGMGLTITRELVELHGGRIWVESTLEEGTRFCFTLPISDQEAALSPPCEPPVSRLLTVEASAPVLQSGKRSGSPSTAAGSPLGARILVVDDEPVNLQVLSNHLASEGYDVELAASGSEALALIEKRAFDLVVLDVMMPRMSGYEVCRTLRQRQSLEDLPVIFLTAKNQVSDLVTGLAAGGNDYLAKPIAKDELLARVRTHLELLSVHRQLARVVDDLEARNAELARFNYTVAHDLKNPLTTIVNFLGLVRRDAATGHTERIEHDLDRLEAAASQLQQLLDELFELSRVGVQTNPPEEVAFGELVHDAVVKLAVQVAERRMEVEVAPDLPMVTGDRARLLEAVSHLLGNALKYLGDQPAPRIEVGVRGAATPDAERLTFYVRDNGMGIEREYHEKVFGLFERLEPEASEGTGIGLALVKRIVEVHGGQVWVESEGFGKGSTFCLSLPIASASR